MTRSERTHLPFDGVDDKVKDYYYYCPVCDEYSMIPIGNGRYRCSRCGIEAKVKDFIIIWNKSLSSEEIERHWRKGNLPISMPVVESDKWLSYTWLYGQGVDIVIYSENAPYDLFNKVCPRCSSRQFKIWAEKDFYLLECEVCKGKFIRIRKRDSYNGEG